MGCLAVGFLAGENSCSIADAKLVSLVANSGLIGSGESQSMLGRYRSFSSSSRLLHSKASG